jgi:hypothetical protein
MITGLLYAQGHSEKPLLMVQAEDINAVLHSITGNREFASYETETEVLSESEAFVHLKLPFGHRFAYIFVGTKE